MNRILFGSLVALGLALTAAPAQADCCFDYSVCRHLSYTHTSKNRCFTFSSHANPLPCAGGGYGGPALWDGMGAYAAPAYGYPAAAPVAVAPATTAPAAAPAFKAPAPAPATSGSTGVQQAGYFYYGQPNTAGYGYNPGYNYGYSYGYGYGYGANYAQVPNYWY